jgi:hypothetical protein
MSVPINQSTVGQCQKHLCDASATFRICSEISRRKGGLSDALKRGNRVWVGASLARWLAEFCLNRRCKAIGRISE